MAMAALVMASSACTSEPDLLTFRTPEPRLDFATRYVGRLELKGRCPVLVLHQGLLKDDVNKVEADHLYVPLFQENFEVRADEQGLLMISPDGGRFRAGDVVTGEGGPYPLPPYDPRSGPVRAVPDISDCGDRPFQINTMQAGNL